MIVAIVLGDGTVLRGDLNTVALAFLMHEFAPVAFGAVDPAEDPRPVDDTVDEPVAAELEHPERFAHLTDAGVGDGKNSH